MASCDCIEKMNEHLAKHNGRLNIAISITKKMQLLGRLTVETEKLDKKKRKPVPAVLAGFCPFCGVKAVPDEEAS